MAHDQNAGFSKGTQQHTAEQSPSFSVLISVYNRDDEHYLASSLNSIINQTCPPSEIVLVKDGPLNEACDKVISNLKQTCIEKLKIIELEKNMGLGNALRIGLDACSNELVARMDTDDICEPNRFEIQTSYLREHPEIDVLSSFIGEFDFDENKINKVRRVPLQPAVIKRVARYRNPINHMAVMFKKSSVLASGNYQHFLWFEDYYLWARMLMRGFRFANIPNILIRVRADNELFRRRGGMTYLKQEIKLQNEFLKMGFTNFPIFLFNIFVRSLFRIIPNKVRVSLYRNYLRHS